MQLPEGENIGKAINDAMRAIEAENDDLKDVLPKTYNRLDNQVLFNLLKNFNLVPMDIEGRCLRQNLRVLPGQLCHGGRPARRRVLHAHRPSSS